MPKWTKESDWLPLSNAIAQVKFWKQDLKYAEEYLEYVERFSTLSGYEKIHKEALEDVQESQEGLKRARLKLEQSKRLE